MALYRFLSDCSVGQFVYPAGTEASTSDAGGTLPANFPPNGNMEPLDQAALTAFYSQGPQSLGLVRAQWTTQAVNPPATYWKGTATAGATSWQLTGLGAGLAPIFE